MVSETLSESVEIGDASAEQKVDELSVSLPRLPRLSEVVPLRPRDAAGVCQVGDERVVAVHQLNEMSSAVVQSPQPSVVQRQLIVDIVCSVYQPFPLSDVCDIPPGRRDKGA